jgi:hypothetical protein
VRHTPDLGRFMYDPTALIALCRGLVQANAGFLLAGGPCDEDR